MQAIWMLIPEEAFILVIVGAGFAVILRLISLSTAIALVCTVCCISLLTPFMDSFIGQLPDWALLLLMIWCGAALFRAIFGKRVGEKVVSELIIRFLLFPFKLFFRLIGLGRRRY